MDTEQVSETGRNRLVGTDQELPPEIWGYLTEGSEDHDE